MRHYHEEVYRKYDSDHILLVPFLGMRQLD